MACFAASLAIFRFAYFEVLHYGGGFFPSLCFFAAAACFFVGLGLIVPRIAIRIALTIADLWSSLH
jgi:hypothetical protein